MPVTQKTEEPAAWEVYWNDIRGGPCLSEQKPSPLWDPQPKCVPLYRHPQPMLTAEERNAIEVGIAAMLSDDELFHDTLNARHAAALRGLLERSKSAQVET